MIKLSNFPNPTKFGVIFIDCWENYELNARYLAMLTELDKRAHGGIETIPLKVFASYNHDIWRPDHTFSNSLRFFYLHKQSEQFVESVMVDNSMWDMEKPNASHVSGALRSHMFDPIIDHRAFLVLEPALFDTLVESQAPSIVDWFVVGGSWQKCYHHRPMGLVNLLSHYQDSPVNFYSADWAVIDQGKVDYSSDELCWEFNGEIYRVSKNHKYLK